MPEGAWVRYTPSPIMCSACNYMSTDIDGADPGTTKVSPPMQQWFNHPMQANCGLFHKGVRPHSKLKKLVVEEIQATITDIPVITAVGFNTVTIEKPFCYFDSFSSDCPSGYCPVYLIASLTSATSKYDTDKLTETVYDYTVAFTATGTPFFTVYLGFWRDLPCPAAGTPDVTVGAEGACTTRLCNGVLPDGRDVSFKYVLVIDNDEIAETKWSDNVLLRERKSPDSLGSGYAGRSSATVIITTILSITSFLLFLLLLSTFILICCCQKGKTESYGMEQKPSLVESLPVPSYEVHHLKNSSPYDNPAYEQYLKQRPQKTTTTINHLQCSSSDNITLHEM
ncbi:Uroplakin-3b [Bagarius yarrelli]|uniref:Uroplakin-3b n=1 Tax=Bagarius yarrelli TaxID=175774 RepID=A0A556V9B8_BAGYA|nr:Uroplakin-3b [Bagarius yarrelli]